MTTRSYKARAFLQAADRLGVAVTVATDREQALASANPAGNLTLEFANVEADVERILEFNQRNRLSAVIAADDEGVVLAARAGQALGLPHNDPAGVAATCNKLALRQALHRHNLPTPEFRAVSLQDEPRAIAAQLRYPCVLKPLFLAASQGVIRADNPESWVRAFERLRRLLAHPELRERGGALADQILAEQYIPGHEFAVEALVDGGEVRILAVYDKPDPLEGPCFEETLYITPAPLQGATLRRVQRLLQHAAESLGLRHGPLHVELRWHDGDFWIIDLAARSIGGLCSRALRFRGGLSLEELILRQALGINVRNLRREAGASGVMMIPIPRQGILMQVQGVEQARRVPFVEEVIVSIPIGQKVVPLPEGGRYLGFIFARAPKARQVETALRRAHEMLTFDIK